MNQELFSHFSSAFLFLSIRRWISNLNFHIQVISICHVKLTSSPSILFVVPLLVRYLVSLNYFLLDSQNCCLQIKYTQLSLSRSMLLCGIFSQPNLCRKFQHRKKYGCSLGILTKFVLFLCVLKNLYFVGGKHNHSHDPFSGITLHFWKSTV